MANANSYLISYYNTATSTSDVRLLAGEAGVIGLIAPDINTVANTKTVRLFGRNYTEGGVNGFGRTLNQNYVTLLQNSVDTYANHANTAQYPQFIPGQLVLETTSDGTNPANSIYMFTGVGTRTTANKIRLYSDSSAPEKIANGTSSVAILNADGNIAVTANGTAITTMSSNGAGNIRIDVGTSTTYLETNSGFGVLTVNKIVASDSSTGFYGNGYNITNINGDNVTTGQVVNAAVAGTVYTAAQPNITSVGTLTSLDVSGKVLANEVSSNGALIAASVSSNGALIAASVSSNGALIAASVSSNGNIIGNNITSNGTLSANAATLNATLAIGGVITSTVPNGTAPIIMSSATKVVNLNADLLDNYESSKLDVADTVVVRDTNGSITANGIIANTLGGSLTTAAQPNITSVGTLTGLTVAGTGITGTLNTGDQPFITKLGNIEITGNITVAGTITGALAGNATSNVTGGNGVFGTMVEAPTGKFTTTVESPSANITNIFSTTGNITNVNSTNISATTGNIANVNSTNVSATTGNITDINSTTIDTVDMSASGNVSVTGNLNTTGAINASNIYASGNVSVTGSSSVSGNSSVTGNLTANNITANYSISSATLTTTGNVSVGNRLTANTIVTTGFVIAGGNMAINGTTLFSEETTFNLLTANVTTLNLGTAATTIDIGASSGTTTINNNLQVDLTATITGNLSAGNISTSGVITATGTITGGNISTAGTATATGNVTGGNLVTGGVVSATGTVTGGNLSTAGTLSVTGNANVGNLGTSGLIVATGNVTGGNLVTTGTGDIGTLKTTAITTGASGTSGTITGTWTLAAGSKLQSTYADLAEYYTSELTITPGTVVEFGGSEEVQTCDTRNSTRIAGVVSTDPAYIMNDKTGQTVPRILVALIGRVPCKVYGTCAKGDMMVAAGGGYAMANNSPVIGSVIGKALENKTTPGIGIIEVVVGRL